MMRAELDVLVEKPLAMSVEEGEEVIRVSEETGCLLLVGHVFRHHAGVRAAC